MGNNKATLLPHINKEVVKDITGFKLCTFLVALEGWRRGLTLKWYKDETDKCKLYRSSDIHGKFFSLSSDKQMHYFIRSRGDIVSTKAIKICQNKNKTKELLEEHGVPIPKGTKLSIDNEEGFLNFAKKIGYPVVIKPLKGSMGRGVYTDIKNSHELKEILKNARSTYKYSEYIIEQYFTGNEYRVYVVGDNAVAATKRIPANIVGDGNKTIKELIEQKNQVRKLNPYLATKPIKIDYEVEMLLKESNYTLDDIPPKGERIFLRKKSNLSSGGDSIDATDELSCEVKKMAVDALKALPSLPHAGVDIIVNPKNNKKGVVIEINSTAEIGFHFFPLEGMARNVAEAIIDYYFPETINQPKSNFYFDYNCLLKPLKNWSAEEIVVPKPPTGKLYAKKITVTGKVSNVGYMGWTRRQALKRGFHGYIKNINKNTMEILLVGNDYEKMQDFKELCYKGSKKSKVRHVESHDIDFPEDKPIEIGFKII